jgi:hypothetical protein
MTLRGTICSEFGMGLIVLQFESVDLSPWKRL